MMYFLSYLQEKYSMNSSLNERKIDSISKHRERKKKLFSVKIKLKNAIVLKLAKDKDMQ